MLDTAGEGAGTIERRGVGGDRPRQAQFLHRRGGDRAGHRDEEENGEQGGAALAGRNRALHWGPPTRNRARTEPWAALSLTSSTARGSRVGSLEAQLLCHTPSPSR